MSGTKIKSLEELEKIVKGLQNKGKKVVFTNGCFDILHYGHVMYLEKARAKGDVLIVAVNKDSSVRRLKGKNRPIVNEHDRLRIIAALSSVDYVTAFGQDTPFEVIKRLKPDVLIKGSDWNKEKIVGADFVKSRGGSVGQIKLAQNRSTTNIIKKIVEISQDR
ncbi:MAG: D-glycero-beta-D-manno-heptose 1-phosphate adenylyltransferase [Candidatus Omnitrophota bacterium]